MADTDQKTEKKQERARKTLRELFEEPIAIDVEASQLHQAFMLPGAGTESSLHPGRPGQKELKMRYHPIYGLIIFNKGKYTLTHGANVIKVDGP